MSLLLFVVGCSSSTKCTVSGKVSFRGKPLGDGAIMFIPLEGTSGPGGNMKIVGGAYAIPLSQNMIAGKYHVWVMAARETGRKFPDPYIRGNFIPEGEQYIPDKYNRATELVAELQPGENTYDLDLE